MLRVCSWVTPVLVLFACHPAATTTLIDLSKIDGPGLVFDDVHVFDGVADLGVVDVVVEGERISHVGAVALDTLPPESGVLVVSGGGQLTLLPGFIDAHAHVSGPPDLARALSYGVTTVLDQFMDEQTMGRIKRQQANGRLLDHADLRSAGLLATAPGGHGTEYGVEIPTVDSAVAAPAFVAERIAAGVDWIKIVYDDGRAVGIPYGNFDRATLSALIEAAHAKDKLAIVHISDLEAARVATELGVDGLAHVFFDREVDDAFIEIAAAHELFITDTLVVVHGICGDRRLYEWASDPNLVALTDPIRLAQMRAGLAAVAGIPTMADCEAADANVRRLHAAGIDILASTDVPNLRLEHGLSMHLELALLADVGLTPSAALSAATEAPARRFGLDDRGRISVGRRADLLLVDGDPTRDIRATRAIVGVWKAGAAFDLDKQRATIAARRAELAPLHEAAAPAGSESGVVSDFDDGTLAVRFGVGWSRSTDTMIGGRSSATVTATTDVSPGAGGEAKAKTDGAMRIEGRVEADGVAHWAGASFDPGGPVNLSRFDALQLSVRGTPGRHALMIFTTSLGSLPAVHMFEIAKDAGWTEVTVEFEQLGIDAWGLVSVFVGALEPGPFELLIDDVRFR